MPSNDEVVIGLPDIQCPSCGRRLDLTKQIQKLSKAQIEAQRRGSATQMSTNARAEEPPSNLPQNAFIVVSCDNEYCEQYNKLKVLKVPRIHTPSVKVDLS